MNKNYEIFVDESLRGFKDYRLVENRLEAFKQIIYTRMMEGDCDHHHTSRVICDRMNLSEDDKIIYSLVFGHSYRNHVAMLFFQEKLFNKSQGDLVKWHDKNWNRLKYAKDTKWNLRKLPLFVEDIKRKLGDKSPKDYFTESLSNCNSNKERFYHLNGMLTNFYSIGRMTAWLAQQTLYELMNWDIDYPEQFINSGDSTWSQYDSLCYLFNCLEIACNQKDSNGNVIKYSPTKDNRKKVSDLSLELYEYLNDSLDIHVDVYNIESVECEFRKTAYGPRKIKEYTFWTTNELIEGFEDLHSLWPEANWGDYVISYMTKGRNLVNGYGYSRDYFKVFTEYGLNLNTHFYYPENPDALKILNFSRPTNVGLEKMRSIWESVENKNELIEKYNPKNFLKFK